MTRVQTVGAISKTGQNQSQCQAQRHQNPKHNRENKWLEKTFGDGEGRG
tara:strand:+ start:455 stop:601 length:147 start_codon:yes stop_codon:yes gene_type:complete